jgi:hypothetical protein
MLSSLLCFAYYIEFPRGMTKVSRASPSALSLAITLNPAHATHLRVQKKTPPEKPEAF